MMRRRFELLCRAVGVGALGIGTVLAWRTADVSAKAPTFGVLPSTLADSTGSAVARDLAGLVARTATDPAWPAVQVSLSAIPSGAVRAVLGAAKLAGVPLSWSDGTSARGLATSASAVVRPQGGVMVRAQGNGSQPLVLRDAVSVLDSVGVGHTGLIVRGAHLANVVTASQGASRASIPVPPPVEVRRVLLMAKPGWEAKFVIAALEEEGWQVDGSLDFGRRASVSTGRSSLPDTTRHAVLVVLDSGLVSAKTLSRYLAQGGGVVLAGDALLDPAMASVRPADARGNLAAVPGALLTAVQREGLDRYRLHVSAGAVVLQGDTLGEVVEPSVVVRRVGIGRVLASAYRETWRWRMAGSEEGMDAHRAWWSGLLSAVAFAPAAPALSVASAMRPGDAAPYADLVAALGPASTTSRAVVPAKASGASWHWLLYAVASLALLAEWCSRRVRGAP